jgi:hypothetical protein
MDNRAAPPAGAGPSAKTFTPKQSQYLDYIDLYTRLHHRPLAETDMQQYFRVTHFRSPDDVDARTRRLHLKATEGRS